MKTLVYILASKPDVMKAVEERIFATIGEAVLAGRRLAKEIGPYYNIYAVECEVRKGAVRLAAEDYKQ